MRKRIGFVVAAICSAASMFGNDISWSYPPSVLSSPGQNGSDPHIAMDPNGNAIAIWIENGFVKSSLKPVSGNWNPIADTLSAYGATNPRVGIDAAGNTTVSWVENGVVKACSKPYNGSWGASVALSGNNATYPALAVGASGDAIVAWVAKSGDIQTSTKLVGKNWNNPLTINASSPAFPYVAIGGNGSNTRAVIVWQDTSNSKTTVYAATRLLSAGWSARAAISDPAHQAGYARAAVDSLGNATAVWYSYDVSGPVYSSVSVQAARMTSNAVWSSWVSLSSPGICNPAMLSATVSYDTSGNAAALWSTSFDAETFSIQSSVKPVYQAWTDPIDLTSGNLYAYQGSLAVTSFGDALALYMFYNGEALQIQSSELDTTGFMEPNWSVPLKNSQGTMNAFPAVAATLVGNHIQSAGVWISSDGMVNSIVASTGTKGIVLPPSNLSVMQSSNYLGAFTEFYNTLSWQASSDATVTGYLIYRNGVFLAQVDGDVLQFVDDNRFQNGPVTYGVAAINNLQIHSQIMTVSFP